MNFHFGFVMLWYFKLSDHFACSIGINLEFSLEPSRPQLGPPKSYKFSEQVKSRDEDYRLEREKYFIRRNQQKVVRAGFCLFTQCDPRVKYIPD